jgi:peptidoglycan-N-acetylglucosamine deacetylase
MYSPLALLAMVITDRRSVAPGSTLSVRSVATFVVPVFTPTGSSNRVILWSHLWFVTVFIWLIVLTPVLVRVVQRVGALTLLIPLVVFASCIALQKRSVWHVPTEVLNTSQFGTFYVLGLLAGYGRLGVFTPGKTGSSRPWLAVAAICAALGTMIALFIEPINRRRPAELYSSKSAYLFVGAAWLALALAFHQPLSEWVKRRPARFLRACTQRTFTLYLWGLPADAIGTAVAKPLLPNRWLAVPVYVGVSLGALALAVVAVGWIEDVSARRKPQLFPALN